MSDNQIKGHHMILRIAFLTCLVFNCSAQDTLPVRWNDGSETISTDVIIKSSIDRSSKLNIWLGGGWNHGGLMVGGVSFYLPNKLLFNADIGGGGMV